MSRLEELIQEYCPDGVTYYKLGDVASVERGKRVIKDQLSQEKGYPVYQNSLAIMGFHTESNYPANTTFVIGAGAAGEIGYSEVDFWAADDCFPIVGKGKLVNRYIYHVIMWKKPYLLSKVRKASIPRLSRDYLVNMVIPVPPLPVQEEIVRILDCFTQLTAELQAELALQKQRFSYYKDIIIENIDKKYYVPLSTIAKQERGKNKGQRITDAFSVTQKGIIRTTDYFGENTKITSNNTSNYYILKPGWFAYSPSRINVGSFNYLRVNHDVIISPLNKVFSVDTDKIVPEFLYQYMTSTTGFSKMLRFREGIEGTGRWHLEFDDMAKMEIPLIPVEKQNKIIDALKNFDVLCNDTLFGLPAEIQARQKQYEYYRDKLLTFPPLP